MRTPWTRAAGLAVLLVAALGVAAARGTSAQAPPGPSVKTVPCEPIASVEGKDSYVAYCAVCHGSDGTGNGPAAVALKAPMPDLTTLAARHDGKYPSAVVHSLLIGRTTIPTHGTATMPIWGPTFRQAEGRAAEHDPRTTLRIKNLVDYLGSLQKPS
jgi:mono/diheme cytochrome c family protein